MNDKPQMVDAAIAIVRRGGKILLCQRKDDDSFGGYWEFPGGKVEDGETLEAALARELLEELDIEICVTHPLPPIEHDYKHLRVRLHPFLCEHVAREPRFIECQNAIWIHPIELRNYPLPPANEKLIEDVIALLDGTSA